jgi:glyoxylase-like metal-dependent hydrolase (beta-lactamase superfamily II)
LLAVVLALCAATPSAQTPPKTLDIYYVDTEGGQATLFVSPTGQTVLVDTGNANPPGRDPQRIMEAMKAAGAKQIDYLVMTHYHGDHVGGFEETREAHQDRAHHRPWPHRPTGTEARRLRRSSEDRRRTRLRSRATRFL